MYRIGEQAVVPLEVYATWSNGKSEPPPELLALTDYLEKHELSAEQLLGLAGTRTENRAETFRLLCEETDRMAPVGDLGEFHIADILAASSHRDLRKYHRKRRQRRDRPSAN